MTWVLILAGLGGFAWGLLGLMRAGRRGRGALIALIGMVVFFVGIGILAETQSAAKKQAATATPPPPAKPTDVYTLATYLNGTISLPPEANVSTHRGNLTLVFQAKAQSDLEAKARLWARDYFYAAYRSGVSGFNTASYYLDDPDGQRLLSIEIGSKAALTVPGLTDPTQPMLDPEAFVAWVEKNQKPVHLMPDQWIRYYGPRPKP